MTISRRILLRATSGSLAGLGTATLLRAPVGAQARRVIVIGAGMAGIATARELEQNGFDVVVLESRSRIGGRIWTDQSWGVPLDRGASWIHGAASPNPIWALRNRYNLRTLPTDYDDITIYDVNGRQISTAQADDDYRNYKRIYHRARRWGRRQAEDSSLKDGVDAMADQNELSPYEQRALDFQINRNVEQDYGGDASDLSNLWYDQDSWLGGRHDVLMRDGYGELVDILAEDLDIRTGNAVLSITVDPSGVTVQTANADFRGAYAVITVPLGILAAERIAFSPPLPPRKRDAIGNLAMGTLNKLFLLFPRRFWDDTEWIGYQANTRGYWALWLDLQPLTGEPILLAFNAGAYGAAIEQKTAQQTVDEAMKVLHTLYGNTIPSPERTMLTRWNADQHTLGSYSHIPPGASGADYRILASPVRRRLFWAGEATMRRYPQTVAGAYLSGLRAASLILAIG
jgi:monoamine oxidase